MLCRDARSQLSAFHDGELGRSEAEALREHLMGCPACRKEASGLRAISRWLEPEEAPPVSAGFTDAVMARLRAGDGLVDAERRAAATLRWMAAAAAVLLAAGALFLALPKGTRGISIGTLEAAPASEVEREIARNDALARGEAPPPASRPSPRRGR